jgi:ribosomal protein S18 acetylase RimI-like enzyme
MRIKLVRTSVAVPEQYDAFDASGEQVGYLRVISDKTRFAYLCDVWVETAHRRRGLARAMVRYAMEHPEFSTVKWLLATLDAHAVYSTMGFSPLQEPQRWMEWKPNPAPQAMP